MIRLSDNARNLSTLHESKLVMNPTFMHVLRDLASGLDYFTVNCFEDSKDTFLSDIENAVHRMDKRKSFVFSRQYRNCFPPRINALVLRH